MNKTTIILISSLFIICILFIILGAWLTMPASQKLPSASPTPSTALPSSSTPKKGSSNYPSDDYLTGVKQTENSKIEKDAHLKAGSIINLRNTLPYTGKNFSLLYDIDTNVYHATISTSNKTDGQKELTDYFSKFHLTEDAVTLTISYQ